MVPNFKSTYTLMTKKQFFWLVLSVFFLFVFSRLYLSPKKAEIMAGKGNRIWPESTIRRLF